MRTDLLFAIHRQILKDHTNERQSYFNCKLASSLPLRFIFKIVEYTPNYLNSILAILYALLFAKRLKFYKEEESHFVMTQNAEEQLFNIIKKEEWAQNISPAHLEGNLRISKSFSFIILFKLSLKLQKKYPFYVVLRVTELYSFYCLLLKIKDVIKNKHFIISTEGNPYANAIIALAHRLEYRVSYFQHSLINNNPVKMSLHGALFQSRYGLSQFIEKKAHFAKYTFFPQSQIEVNSVEIIKTIGLCLNKTSSFNEIKKLITEIEELKLKYIIRPHPHQISNIKVTQDKIDDSKDYEYIINNCDLIIAGNTNLHINLLRRNIPTLYLATLNSTFEYTLPFIEDGTILEIESIYQVRSHHFINDYYSSPLFLKRISKYIAPFKKELFYSEIQNLLES